MTTTDWFTADKEGLAQLIADKLKVFLIHELLQNAIDEDVQEVSISIEMEKGRPLAHVVVEDDSPEGFRKLSDAYTLYAPSYKKNDPKKLLTMTKKDFALRLKYLKKIGAVPGFEQEWRPKKPPRDPHNLELFRCIWLPFSAEEWCNLCMSDGEKRRAKH